MKDIAWYHGGDFKNGKPHGTYVYITDNKKEAKVFANDRRHVMGAIYRLRSEYCYLVGNHDDGSGRKVVCQLDLQQLGGALMVFEETPISGE